MKKNRFSHRYMYHYSAHLLRAMATPGIIFITISGNLVLSICAYLFYRLEHGYNPAVKGPFDAVWSAFSTVTTVRYGDMVPITVGGRIVGISLMLSGAVFFFGFMAILITAFSSMTAQEVKKTELLTKAE